MRIRTVAVTKSIENSSLRRSNPRDIPTRYHLLRNNVGHLVKYIQSLSERAIMSQLSCRPSVCVPWINVDRHRYLLSVIPVHRLLIFPIFVLSNSSTLNHSDRFLTLISRATSSVLSFLPRIVDYVLDVIFRLDLDYLFHSLVFCPEDDTPKLGEISVLRVLARSTTSARLWMICPRRIFSDVRSFVRSAWTVVSVKQACHDCR